MCPTPTAGRTVGAVGGRRIRVSRLRARSVAGHELALPSFAYAAGRDPLDARTLEAIALGVTTRKYCRALDPLPAGIRERAVAKSSVSRRFVALTRAHLTTWLAQPLDDHYIRIVFLDGLHFRDHVILIALGVDSQGQKHVLALREGTTENATVCKALLADLRERGLDLERPLLFVIDGGTELRKAIREACGAAAVVHRCHVRKRRNVLEHLPERMRPRVRRVLDEAYGSSDAALATRRLLQLAAGLEQTHPGAAASLREGLEETLTLQRLGVTGALYRTLRSTNAIENLNGLVGHFVRHVRRWRDGRMLVRWIAAGLREAGRSFRRVRGTGPLPKRSSQLDYYNIRRPGRAPRGRSCNSSSNIADREPRSHGRWPNVPNVDRTNVVNVDRVNEALAAGNLDVPGLFPRLESLRDAPAVFRIEMGLETLPAQPGVLLIRGARQYGKSTWLEASMRATVREHGAGTALFLDGDYLRDADHLSAEVSRLAAAYRADAPVRRLFVDEITAVADWERGLKRVLDRGELQRVLVVTTGSRATDLRRGSERLPGRKGKLARTSYLFPPISYAEFLRAGGSRLGPRRVGAYLLSGGSPVALGEMIRAGRLPEWAVDSVRDWVQGECARSGRSHRSLVAVMEQLHRHGGTALGQTKLARDAGLANNTVAAGWIEMLSDLLCVGTSAAWDAAKRVEVARKPAKYPFVNLLAAAVWSPDAPRAPEDFGRMQPERQAAWHEWAVAQELFRRAAIRGQADPERIPHWQGGGHEIDFVAAADAFIEVKRGQTSALDFAWFAKVFPKGRLTVVCATPFEGDRVRGVTLEAFLTGEA